ncbi:MAG: HEAT repeat domain-containing protein [Planctomycetia bacterium]
MHLKPFLAVVIAVAFSVIGPHPAFAAEPLPAEAELIAVLRSGANEADKAIVCKKLAIKGSAAAVGDLAQLLANERLASWARIPLEVIPGPEADAALRTAAGSLSGRLLVGVINSIGVRRDAAAASLLEARLGDPDAEVAAAAAAALGKIGTPAAATILAKRLPAAGPRLDDVAQASVVCAERLLAAGQATESAKLYDAVRTASVSEQRKAEATRGLILARGKDGIPLLLETLRSPSRCTANIGLFTARELLDGPTAGDVDVAIVEEITRMAGGGAAAQAALLVEVLADRNADGGAPAGLQATVLRWAAAGPQVVRLAALEAIGRIGDASAVDPLVALAADPAVADAARMALVSLPGEAVNRVVIGRLSGADPKLQPILAQVVGARRIPAIAQLQPLVASGDATVRAAALEALGNVVDLANLGLLVDVVVKPRDAVEGEAAHKALLTACVRMPDRDACAEKLATALTAASGTTKTKLLDIVGDVGGAKALATVKVAALSGEESLADAATRLLGKWMTADAAPVLLDLAAAPIGEKYQTRAIRGYIRIARQFALADAERAEMCKKALEASKDAADRKSVLEILPRYPSPAMLAVAEQATKLPGLEAEAKAAADAIRAKLPK